MKYYNQLEYNFDVGHKKGESSSLDFMINYEIFNLTWNDENDDEHYIAEECDIEQLRKLYLLLKVVFDEESCISPDREAQARADHRHMTEMAMLYEWRVKKNKKKKNN